ncbi:Translational repressor [Cryptotrichosporon argae]
MSDPAAAAAAPSPSLSVSATLAPPKPTSRPASAASSRSNSSRRSRGSAASPVSGSATPASGQLSRSSSRASHAPGRGQAQAATRTKRSGSTTTISGGTTLATSKGGNRKDSPRPRENGKSDKAAKPKPAPIDTSASTAAAAQPTPRSIHTPAHAPVDAMEAAVNAATKKHQEQHGGNALNSLQKMISELKTIPAGSAPSTASSGGSQNRSASMSKDKGTKAADKARGVKARSDSPASIGSKGSADKTVTENVAIPATNGQKKLKADAPSFTPSSFTASSPPAAASPPQQMRSASLGSAPRRQSSGAYVAPGLATSPAPVYANPLPHFPLAYASQLSAHPEVDDSLIYEAYQQQQLLAAQQLQLQMIQAQYAQQIQAQQAVQAQVQAKSREGSFMAPRFQALAAQRVAIQMQQQTVQQQQALQMAEAQRLYEMQQQAITNTPPVFEEDDEVDVRSPGSNGRPQLAPSFTFGAKRRDSDADKQPVMINRSEGIGGAQATGLAGLAARAHRRTGSELSTNMERQLEIQRQIEFLQKQQRELMKQDSASGAAPSLDQLNTALGGSSRHRRAQSNITSPGGAPPAESVNNVLSPVEDEFAAAPAEAPQPARSGHSRSQSMNFSAGSQYDILGHSRSQSRGFESGNWRVNGNAGSSGLTADLASAQAQLASLAQFRAAVGGGHSKMASFSFPNMLPNLLAATTLQTPSGQGSLWQQQQAFQLQLQQNSQGPQRKSLFAPYLPQASLPPLLNAGKLVVGILRVNKKNRSDAYVATDVLDADIYICGSKDRNRALEGDVVAVELLDVDEVWGTKKDKEEKKRKKEDTAAHDKASLSKKKDDVEVEGQGLVLYEDDEVNDETKPAFAGHVVAVLERMPGQLFSGQLGVLRPSSAATKEKQEAERRERDGDKAKKDEPEARPKIVWFKPTDKRVPLIAIPTEQAPADFIENPDAHANKLFVASIKRWPITSLHPFGTLVEELGEIGNAEVESSAILKDCNFPTEEFSDMTLKGLPPLPWTIPDRELEIRQDLRDQTTFTVDPGTAKDLDDALSVKVNEDGTTTVGVHIADVSYFVKPNSAIDKDARKRATSVYLVQRAVPMLPPQLCEELCSLVPDVDRLTFSGFFTFDEDAKLVDRKFAKTIIRSRAQLSYDEAQTVIDGGQLARSNAEAVEANIRALQQLAAKLRRKRIDNGALISNKLKVSFVLDDRGKPIDTRLEERSSAKDMIQEFMLLTNTAVAAIIANGLPEQALLRRHEAPIERRMAGFVERVKRLGYTFDGTDAGTLQKSFEAVGDPEIVQSLNLLCRKSMQQARYYCTGMLDIAKFSHWALNEPVYTHFTSPIRRYADVLVHRMLEACLAGTSGDVKFIMDRDQVAKCAQQCNIKKQGAKQAEDQSVHLYLCLLVNDLTERYGPVIREGRVTAVLDHAFDVLIPEFGIEKRVHADKMPLDNLIYDEHRNALTLYWSNKDTLTHVAESSEDEHILRLKSLFERHALAQGATQAADAAALFDEAGASASTQFDKSARRVVPAVDGCRTDDRGRQIQEVKELDKVAVIVTADMAKSPPVLVVYACNPYVAA